MFIELYCSFLFYGVKTAHYSINKGWNLSKGCALYLLDIIFLDRNLPVKKSLFLINSDYKYLHLVRCHFAHNS